MPTITQITHDAIQPINPGDTFTLQVNKAGSTTYYSINDSLPLTAVAANRYPYAAGVFTAATANTDGIPITLSGDTDVRYFSVDTAGNTETEHHAHFTMTTPLGKQSIAFSYCVTTVYGTDTFVRSVTDGKIWASSGGQAWKLVQLTSPAAYAYYAGMCNIPINGNTTVLMAGYTYATSSILNANNVFPATSSFGALTITPATYSLFSIAANNTNVIAVGYLTTTVSGIFLSTDQGATFSLILSTGLPTYLRTAVSIGTTKFLVFQASVACGLVTIGSPSTYTAKTALSTTAYSACCDGTNVYCAMNNGSVAKCTVASVDTTITWRYVSLNNMTSCYGICKASDGSIIAVGHTSGQGIIYRSTDQGDTWTCVYLNSVNGTQLYSVAAGANNKVMAVGQSTSHLSSDNGATWPVS